MFSARELGIRKVHTEYRSRAHRLELSWDLTREEFIFLLTSPCHYCGVGPGRVIRINDCMEEDELFVCGGIDRIDNSQGYIKGNVVPACTICNIAKRNMRYDVFLEWATRVYEHRIRKQ